MSMSISNNWKIQLSTDDGEVIRVVSVVSYYRSRAIEIALKVAHAESSHIYKVVSVNGYRI